MPLNTSHPAHFLKRFQTQGTRTSLQFDFHGAPNTAASNRPGNRGFRRSRRVQAGDVKLFLGHTTRRSRAASSRESQSAYTHTALHELGHATGHPACTRPTLVKHGRFGSTLVKHGRFGSEAYAGEELRAEIAAMMTDEQLGVGHEPRPRRGRRCRANLRLAHGPRATTEHCRRQGETQVPRRRRWPRAGPESIRPGAASRGTRSRPVEAAARRRATSPEIVANNALVEPRRPPAGRWPDAVIPFGARRPSSRDPRCSAKRESFPTC